MKHLISLLLVGYLLAPVGAIAATQNISETQARGEAGSIPIIKLNLNSGLPIKMPSGYRVYKGWLDNDSLAEIDGDRPFDQGASIVYLVARTRGSGKLSLMVRDHSGTDHLFVIKLTSGGKASPDLVIIRGAGGGSELSPRVDTVSNGSPTELVRSGLRRSGLLEGSELYQAVEQFIGLVDGGMPAEMASNQIGLDLAVIRKLIKMGQQPQLQQVSNPKTLPVQQLPKTKFKGDVVKVLPAPPPIAMIAIPIKSEPVKVVVDKPTPPPGIKPRKVKPKKVKVKREPDRPARVAMATVIGSPIEPFWTSPIAPPAPKKLNNHQRANQLVMGLLKAPKRDRVRGQIAIALLRRNTPLNLAAKKSGLSVKVLETYIQKGGQRNVPKV